MAQSKIKRITPFNTVIRELQITYSINANSTFNTNLKTLIDNNMPSGYHFGGLCGFASNDVTALTTNFGYYDSAYSLQLANRSGSAISSKLYRVFYIAIPD